MNKIDNIIEIIRSKWSLPASTPKTSEPFRLRCSIENRQNEFKNPFYSKLPLSLEEWWSKIEKAVLFEDVDYGQWGLRLLNEKESLEQTAQYKLKNQDDFLETDIVIGSFLGDLDLLIISLNELDFGQIIISTPIDSRKDWYFLKIDFSNFLEQYLDNEGDKFWEFAPYF